VAKVFFKAVATHSYVLLVNLPPPLINTKTSNQCLLWLIPPGRPLPPVYTHREGRCACTSGLVLWPTQTGNLGRGSGVGGEGHQ